MRILNAKELNCDVVIAGCGVSGLYAALNLPASANIIMLTKTTVEECDSMLAQGGICVLHDEADYDAFYEDTMRAGHYENRAESVDIMIRSSRDVINDLVKRGVGFEHEQNGELAYTREGAHSRPRICFHGDITGEEITTKLLANVRRLPNVSILEHVEVVDIIESPQRDRCIGVECVCHRGAEAGAEGERLVICAPYTMLATGGIGGTYERSTNFPSLTGDACRIARNHGVELEHMDYVQIHPTSLYVKHPGRAFLISESCRGEGAILLNKAGERFTDELQPRDVVSAAIYEQMEKDGTDYVRLSFERMAPEEITGHFQHIYEHCLEEGFDLLREPIPVVPAQHYFMGGVHVDSNSQTTMPNLFALGETACNGVHGKNRLASNSLLESLVFAQRAARLVSAKEAK
jgi:L-aspartate oxidase